MRETIGWLEDTQMVRTQIHHINKNIHSRKLTTIPQNPPILIHLTIPQITIHIPLVNLIQSLTWLLTNLPPQMMPWI